LPHPILIMLMLICLVMVKFSLQVKTHHTTDTQTSTTCPHREEQTMTYYAQRKAVLNGEPQPIVNKYGTRKEEDESYKLIV